MTATEHVSTKLAQRRLIEAIASVHHYRADAAGSPGDPLAALAFGVATARRQAAPGDLAGESLAPVLAALETLILTVRHDIAEPTPLPRE